MMEAKLWMERGTANRQVNEPVCALYAVCGAQVCCGCGHIMKLRYDYDMQWYEDIGLAGYRHVGMANGQSVTTLQYITGFLSYMFTRYMHVVFSFLA